MNQTEAQVWSRIQAMNRAWTKGHTADLRKYFHRDMVAVTPMDRDVLHGIDACVASWQRFVDAAQEIAWKELDAKVRVFGDAAVATYSYAVTFKMNGERREEKGRDMFFLVRENGDWYVVADQFSPIPAQ